MKLTQSHLKALRQAPFHGFGVGSNLYSLCALRVEGEEIDGGDIDALLREGLLAATELDEPRFIRKGGRAGPYGEIPDLEATHRISITPAGRAALQQEQQP